MLQRISLELAMPDPLWWYLAQAMLGEVYFPCRQEQLPSPSHYPEDFSRTIGDYLSHCVQQRIYTYWLLQKCLFPSLVPLGLSDRETRRPRPWSRSQ